MQITNQTDSVVFSGGLTIQKDTLVSLTKKADRKYILITYNTGSREAYFRIYFDDVTSPSCVDIDSLYTTLSGYFDVSAASGPTHTFTATSAQTQFDCGDYFTLNDNYKVFVDGSRQSWGHSRSENVVTFDSAPGEGAEVIIEL